MLGGRFWQREQEENVKKLMCGPQKVNTTSRQVGGGTLATTALPLSSFLLKNSQFQSNLVFVGQKARETGPMVQPCTRTIPASDPQRRGPKVPSTRGAAGKARACGEQRLSHQHRYLHETSTAGHQDPLREAAGRTTRLLPDHSRHLAAQQRPLP